nr:uncharacterized protein LOC103415272 [Malus domestica]
MSKRAAKNLTIKPVQHEQNTMDDKYAEVFKDNHQPKRVRRNIYVENFAVTFLPQIDEFVSPNLFLDHQSSSSQSETNLFLDHQSSSSHAETQHMTCNRQISDRYDKKGTNVVDVSKDVENTVKKTLHIENSNVMNRGQAFFQKKRTGIVKEYADLGDKNYKCTYCGAYFWLKESLKQRCTKNQLVFTLCCQQGKISLPISKPAPYLLDLLLDPNGGHKSSSFRENIRAYNSMFSFTSMGAKIDHSINDGSSPYIFKISGQVCHLMGSLLPPDNQPPKFAQLYVYDTYNEVQNRLKAFDSDGNNGRLDPQIVESLIKMFDESNELVKLFRIARYRFETDGLTSLKMTLLARQPIDSKQYDQPTSDEIGGLIVGDIGLSDSNRDIIIESKSDGLKRVTKLNPKFMALQYPILFPYGEDGYRPDLKWNENYKGPKTKRQRVPMRAFIAYQIQEREPWLTTLLKGGRLFQQYIVDSYATLEEDRLDYIRQNQKNLRTDVYKGIYDAVARGDNDANNVGQKIILPASYTGSPRYMINNYQDAMAICREYGHPDLFITFTCNVKWPEIIREFEKKTRIQT